MLNVIHTNTKKPNYLEKLQINTDITTPVLVEFVRNEIQKVGFKKVVLGLSGGIDSALSCYIAARAMGPENVLAIKLPYRASSSDSLIHADLMIDDLGIRSETLEITDMVEPLFAKSPDMSALRKGNVMSRARMICIYDRSAADNALVIGTSNKTELLLGYGTIFGDLASAVNPIGDLYKTQVRQLSRAIGVPAPIIDKPPSADLIPDQTDEDDFGFSYEEVDQLLYMLIDERYTPQEAIEAGFAADFVQRVTRMVQRNHYKRMMPVIPKISGRSINHDFRYLRDWGS